MPLLELGDKEVPDHEPDPRLDSAFFRFRSGCISSEEMQRLWARILSGEVQSPGGTSLRTLDTLRNMSKIDAEMFNDACSYVFLPLQEQGISGSFYAETNTMKFLMLFAILTCFIYKTVAF